MTMPDENPQPEVQIIMKITVTAKGLFERRTFTVTITVDPPGAGIVELTPAPPADGYAYGTSVTLKAIPAPGTGYDFASWTLPDGSKSTQNPVTITLK